jgi:hypothetical protein
VTNPVLRAALACADKGWPVFPCYPGRKLAATPNGYLDATTDRSQISEWFAAHPERNLAVATGSPGPDVLDVGVLGREADEYHGLWHLREAGLVNGATACIDTAGGGLHVYFEGSAQRSDSLPAWHLDFIAKGGYVLVPPSQVGGRPYSGVNMRGEPGSLDWDAAVHLLDPSRTCQHEADPRSPDREAEGPG